MMGDKIDFKDSKSVQHYLLALREVISALRGLDDDKVNNILDRYMVRNVYYPEDEIKYRLNIDFEGE